MVEICAFVFGDKVDIVLVGQIVVAVHVSEIFAVFLEIYQVIFEALNHLSFDLSL